MKCEVRISIIFINFGEKHSFRNYDTWRISKISPWLIYFVVYRLRSLKFRQNETFLHFWRVSKLGRGGGGVIAPLLPGHDAPATLFSSLLKQPLDNPENHFIRFRQIGTETIASRVICKHTSRVPPWWSGYAEYQRKRIHEEHSLAQTKEKCGLIF